MDRRKTRPVKVGDLIIGGGAPISVQSMVKTDPRDIDATISEIKAMEEAGCRIIRVAVPDQKVVYSLKEIKRASKAAIVADIHFDYRLAIEAMRQGVDKIRINPGNIGGRDKIEMIAKEAKEMGIPIRVGVNSGSLPNGIEPSSDGLVKTCLESIRVMERVGFYDIVISLKASSIHTTIKAYRTMAGLVDYPFHLGITEAGPLRSGIIKSSIGIGTLLLDGIGDTIRVSLTCSPIEEIKVGFDILRALGLCGGVNLVSCPTCGRCEVDLFRIVKEFEERVSSIPSSIKIAIMGCIVNGPGEARDADIGIAFGKGIGLLFKKGKVVRRVREEDAVGALLEML